MAQTSESLISVIIPIFNAAPYLPACLDSVLAQTYARFELLLVDDGSTDEGAAICESYASLDDRVSVIHQTNGGASAARNAALGVIRGEYVAFIDADDVVHHRYLEILLLKMQQYKADVVQSPYSIIDASKRSCYNPQRLSQYVPVDSDDLLFEESDAALLSMLYQQPDGPNTSPCKLFRASLFEGLFFPIEYRVYEDLWLMAQLYQRTQRIVCMRQSLYYYFKEAGGTLCSQSVRRQDAFELLERLEAQFLVLGKKQCVRAVRERRLSVAFHTLRLLARLPHTDLHKAMAHRCWQHILQLRGESIHDSSARLKNRLTAAFSYLLKR